MKKIIVLIFSLIILTGCMKVSDGYCYGDKVGGIDSIDLKVDSSTFGGQSYMILSLDTGTEYTFPYSGEIYNTDMNLYYDKDCTPHYYISESEVR